MSEYSGIEWTDSTWNPVSGCTKVSPGCKFCYAERITERFSGKGSFGKIVLYFNRLDIPLHWRKPRRIFVCSMSDLFHEAVPDEFIEQVFDIMLLTQHTYQILTKRPARMKNWVSQFLAPSLLPSVLENIWLGVSVEDQKTADERIPPLLQTPAAVRFVSYEPALGPVDFSLWLRNATDWAETCSQYRELERLNWLIVGGESGPGARPFDLAWARSAVAQCKAAGLPCFVKQLGSNPVRETGGAVGVPTLSRYPLKDCKGADPSEWPSNLQVRQFPEVSHRSAPRR